MIIEALIELLFALGFLVAIIMVVISCCVVQDSLGYFFAVSRCIKMSILGDYRGKKRYLKDRNFLFKECIKEMKACSEKQSIRNNYGTTVLQPNFDEYSRNLEDSDFGVFNGRSFEKTIVFEGFRRTCRFVYGRGSSFEPMMLHIEVDGLRRMVCSALQSRLFLVCHNYYKDRFDKNWREIYDESVVQSLQSNGLSLHHLGSTARTEMENAQKRTEKLESIKRKNMAKYLDIMRKKGIPL